MFLASMAFVVAAIVQVEIDVSCPPMLQCPFLRVGWGIQEASFSGTAGRPRALLTDGPGARGDVEMPQGQNGPFQALWVLITVKGGSREEGRMEGTQGVSADTVFIMGVGVYRTCSFTIWTYRKSGERFIRLKQAAFWKCVKCLQEDAFRILMFLVMSVPTPVLSVLDPRWHSARFLAPSVWEQARNRHCVVWETGGKHSPLTSVPSFFLCLLPSVCISLSVSLSVSLSLPPSFSLCSFSF